MPSLRGRARGLPFLMPPASWRAVPAQESSLCLRTRVLGAASEQDAAAWPSQALVQVHCVPRVGLLSAHLLSPRDAESPGGGSPGARGEGAKPLGSCPGVSWLGGLHPTPLPRATPSGHPPHLGVLHHSGWLSTTQAPCHHPSPMLLYHQPVLPRWERQLGAATLPTVGLSGPHRHPQPRGECLGGDMLTKDALNESAAILEHQEEVRTASPFQHQGATPNTRASLCRFEWVRDHCGLWTQTQVLPDAAQALHSHL